MSCLLYGRIRVPTDSGTFRLEKVPYNACGLYSAVPCDLEARGLAVEGETCPWRIGAQGAAPRKGPGIQLVARREKTA